MDLLNELAPTHKLLNEKLYPKQTPRDFEFRGKAKEVDQADKALFLNTLRNVGLDLEFAEYPKCVLQGSHFKKGDFLAFHCGEPGVIEVSKLLYVKAEKLLLSGSPSSSNPQRWVWGTVFDCRGHLDPAGLPVLAPTDQLLLLPLHMADARVAFLASVGIDPVTKQYWVNMHMNLLKPNSTSLCSLHHVRIHDLEER